MRCFSQLTPLSTEIRMEDNFPTGNHIISANQVDKTLSSLRRFDRSLPMSLLKAHESVLRMFIPHLRAHDLSPQQWRVMRALADTDALDVSELSEACSLLRPSVSRILQNLQARGIISRRPCPSDSRRSLLTITDKGRRLIAEIAPESEARYDWIESRFGRENLFQLYDLLHQLVDSLDETPNDNDLSRVEKTLRG